MFGQWTSGYTQKELDDAQARYDLRFPPDLIALYRERRLVDGYDWTTDNQRLRGMLAWPFEMLLFDVEQGFWLPEWGEAPRSSDEKAEVLRQQLSAAPKLIPLFAHRFLPDTPHEAGNPVLSMHGFDTIYYGADLTNYLDHEFGGGTLGPVSVHVPFWSDLIANFDVAYEQFSQADAAKD